MTIAEIRSRIGDICSVSSELDREQILDIILGRGAADGDKTVSFQRITKDWTAADWKSVMKEFYVSYQKADLAKMKFMEMQPGISISTSINARKELATYKKAPDNYYLSTICSELDTSGIDATHVQNQDVRNSVLTAVYAAISQGENYGTACYPPTIFIREVAGLDISPEEFRSICLYEMGMPTSFEKLVVAESKINKARTKEMRQSYKRLMGKGAKPKAEAIRQTADRVQVAASHTMRRGRQLTEHPQVVVNNHVTTATSSQIRRHEHRFLKFNAGPTSALYIALLILCLISLVLTFIYQIYVSNSIMNFGQSAGGVAGFFLNFPIISTLIKGIVTILSWVRIALPILGLIGVISVRTMCRNGFIGLSIIIWPAATIVGIGWALFIILSTIAAIGNVDPVTLRNIANYVL